MPYLGKKKLKQLHAEYLELYGHLDQSDSKLVEDTVKRFIVEQNIQVLTEYMPKFYAMQENKAAFVIQWNQATTNYILQFERLQADPFVTEETREHCEFLRTMMKHLQNSINEYHKNCTLYETNAGEVSEDGSITSGEYEPHLDVMQEADNILNVEEAAEFLKLAKKTVYTLTSKKLIPHSKRGKRLYFTKSDLMVWISGAKRKTLDELETSATAYVNKHKIGRK